MPRHWVAASRPDDIISFAEGARAAAPAAVHVIRTIIVIIRHPKKPTGVNTGHECRPTWL